MTQDEYQQTVACPHLAAETFERPQSGNTVSIFHRGAKRAFGHLIYDESSIDLGVLATQQTLVPCTKILDEGLQGFLQITITLHIV